MKLRKNSPPIIAAWILSKLNYYEDNFALADAIEQDYFEFYAQEGKIKSWIWYWFHTIEILIQFIKCSIYWSVIMIKNYLKITFRNLLKYKGFSFINITGFALSISLCLIIIIFIKDEKSSDGFHKNKDCIFRVYTTDKEIKYSEVRGWATSPATLGPILIRDYPDVEDAVRLRRMGGNVLHEETAIPIRGMFAESSFFTIFGFQLDRGNPETALTEPFSIVISQENANKFFGNDNPIDQTLTLETYGDFKVTGVLKNIHNKSHFKFDVLVSFETIKNLESREIFAKNLNQWVSFSSYYTYILLRDKEAHSKLETQFPGLVKRLFPEEHFERFGFQLQPLTKINLGINLINPMPGTKHSFEVIFIPFVALIIIFLACFNYIILSIARSLKRSKEIGLRKVIGANRSQIITQFLSEAFIITLIAVFIACIFILWLIPAFNGLDIIEYTKSHVNINLLNDFNIYIIFFLFAIVVSLVAGIYPALYLSSFLPVNALKGVLRKKGSSRFLTRKILMISQFTVSIIAIITIMMLYRLHSFMISYDKGIDTENIVNIDLQKNKYETFRNELLSNKDIITVSASSGIPVYGSWGMTKIKPVNMDEELHVSYYSFDPIFIENFNLTLVAGRNFSDEYSTDKTSAAIINEKAVKIFGFDSPEHAIGKLLIKGKKQDIYIIGVLKDFNFRRLENEIGPLYCRYKPEYFEYANVRFMPGKKSEMKTSLISTWEKVDKVHSIDYQFYDDLETQDSSLIMGIVTIASWICGFIIIIALLGLLGMTTFTTEMRTKEVGIRKVLGATASSISVFLSKDFIKLIIYSGIIAIPLAYLGNSLFYQNFAFRPEFNIWVYPVSIAFVIVLALITIGTQTIKAAFTNPVETIREE